MIRDFEKGLAAGYRMALQDLNIIGKDMEGTS